METLWFVIIAFLFVGYAVLDGFDLGVGILFPFVAKTDDERTTVLSAIGPIWNGNEVWLIAAGGTLLLAFPKAFASALSGMYLAVFLILWCLIGRAASVELRSHVDHPLWRGFWNAIFFVCSLVLALLFGVALGNVVRGFPLNAQGRFFLPLWTDFRASQGGGILDWYTLIVGGSAVAVLALHGANYLILKTGGEIRQRAQAAAACLSWVSGAAVLIAAIATCLVQRQTGARYFGHPLGFAIPLLALIALILLIAVARRRVVGIRPFALSGMQIAALLASAFFILFPNLLIATEGASDSLTVFNAATSTGNLRVALMWLVPGFLLILAYTCFMHRAFWGEVNLMEHEAY